jgi:hypothetical protein
VFDPKGKQMLPDKDKYLAKGVVVALGGNTVPEFSSIILGVDKEPGKYKIVISVEEKATKKQASLTQEVEVLPPDFGFIHVQAPALGVLAQDYVSEFALVGWQRDASKAPKITVTTRIIDEATGKPTTTQPNVSKVPDDLPKTIEWAKLESLRMSSPA